MNHKPRVIILDLDGTLLHSDKSVSQRTKKVLKECRKQGIADEVTESNDNDGVAEYLEKYCL